MRGGYDNDTVGPLVTESPEEKQRVSTGALESLDDPFVAQTKYRKNVWVSVDTSYHRYCFVVLMVSTNCKIPIQIVVIQYLRNSIVTSPAVLVSIVIVQRR